MSRAWNARLRATWHGEVSNANLVATFAATARLTQLQQALEDRRLAAQIEHVGHDWRAILAVGQIAAPLWLANALVGLADAFYAADMESHPDRPTSVRAYTHDLVAALLAPVEDLIAGVAAALADPGHRSVLGAPLQVGPDGDVADGALPDPIYLAYARGLAGGAAHIHTNAAAALLATRTAIADSTPPDWLTRELARLDGVLQAASARLEMSEERLAALSRLSTDDAAGLVAICADLWQVTRVAVVAGQMLADPHLFAEAAAAAASRPISAASFTTPATSMPVPHRTPPTPLPSDDTAEEERLREIALPVIDAGAAPLREKRERAAPTAPDAELRPAASPLPSISEAGGEAGGASSSTSGGLPSIGETLPAATPGGAAQPPKRKPPARETEEKPPIQFPEIG
jgi:hypothetical protein